MSRANSIVVVGGGIVGLCVAWYARREGLNVTVVERGAREHDCCSLGNAGLIVPSHVTPIASPGKLAVALRSLFRRTTPFRARWRFDKEWLRWAWLFMRSANARHVATAAPVLCDLSLLSRRCYEELAQQLGNPFGFERNGVLMLSRTRHDFEEECEFAEFARGFGLEPTVHDAAGIAKLEPDVELNVVGGVLYPLDCQLKPHTLVATLVSELERRGIEFRWQTEARGWRVNDGRVSALETSQGELKADAYVLSAGAWTPRTLDGLGIRVPVEAGKGYHLHFERAPIRVRRGAILTEAGVAVTPMGDGLRFAGTLDLAGLDGSVVPERIAAIVNAIPKFYPALTPEVLQGVPAWAGLRPCSPDGLPYIGRTRRIENFFVAAGHSMMGVTLGPATGVIISRLLTGKQPGVDLKPLQPERYS